MLLGAHPNKERAEVKDLFQCSVCNGNTDAVAYLAKQALCTHGQEWRVLYALPALLDSALNA